MDALGWIYGLITEDTTLAALVDDRVYSDLAPEGTTFPFVTMTLVDVMPSENAFADNIFDVERWDIKVVDKSNSFKNARTIAEKIRTLIHKKTGTGIHGARFIQKRQYSQNDRGVVYRYIVQEFEIYTNNQ